MTEKQFLDELKTSLEQAIEYAGGNQSKARTMTVAKSQQYDLFQYQEGCQIIRKPGSFPSQDF